MVSCRSCGRNIASGVIRCAKCSTPFHLSCSHRYKISPEGIFNVCCGPNQSPFTNSYPMRTRRSNKRRQQQQLQQQQPNINNLNNVNNLNNINNLNNRNNLNNGNNTNNGNNNSGNNNSGNNNSGSLIAAATSSQDDNMRYGKVMKLENMGIIEKPLADYNSNEDEIQIIEEDYTNIEIIEENVNQYEDNGNDVILEEEDVNIITSNNNPVIINEIPNRNNDSNSSSDKVTLETVWQGISSLQTSISSISSSLDTVSTQLNTFDPRINELESSMNTIKSKTLHFENVQNDVSGLREDLTRIANELENLKSRSTNDQTVGISEIMVELKERDMKARNLIMYNVPEDNLRISQDYSTVEDINKFNELVAARDASRAREILGNIPNVDLDEIDTRRLGRSNPNICRPLRVSLSCKEDVITVMKNRRFVEKQYTVKTDLTKFQQRKIKELKEELDKINVNKENPSMTIKFVSGEPKLMPIRREFQKFE